MSIDLRSVLMKAGGAKAPAVKAPALKEPGAPTVKAPALKEPGAKAPGATSPGVAKAPGGPPPPPAEPVTPSPKVQAPSPQSSEKIADPATQRTVTFADSVHPKPTAVLPPGPPPSILKPSSIKDTVEDTVRDPTRADTQEWDGTPALSLLRSCSVDSLSSTATTQVMQGRSKSLLSMPSSSDVVEATADSLDRDLSDAFDKVCLEDEDDEEVKAALKAAEAAERAAEEASRVAKAQKERLAQARQARELEDQTRKAAECRAMLDAVEKQKARALEEQKARELEEQKRKDAEILDRQLMAAEEQKAKELEEQRRKDAEILAQRLAEQKAKELEEQRRKDAEILVQQQKAAEEQKAKELEEQKRKDAEILAQQQKAAEEQKAKELEEQRRKDAEILAQQQKAAEEQKAKELQEQKRKDARALKLQQAQERAEMARKLQEVQEEAMKEELAKIRAEERLKESEKQAAELAPAARPRGEQQRSWSMLASASSFCDDGLEARVCKADYPRAVPDHLYLLDEPIFAPIVIDSDSADSAKAITPPGSSAATHTEIAPKSKVPKAKKASARTEKDDFELPELSDDEKKKYKNFWNRMRSKSFESVEDSNTTASEDEPAAPAATIQKHPAAEAGPAEVAAVATAAAPEAQPESVSPEMAALIEKLAISMAQAMTAQNAQRTDWTPSPPPPKAAYAPDTEIDLSEKGGAFKMQAFAKFVQAGCQGLALEAVLRFSKQQEEIQQARADEFIAMRRVSTDRNNPRVETFLYYNRERRAITTRSLDEIAVSLGANANFALQLMDQFKGNDPNSSSGDVPPTRSTLQHPDTPGLPPSVEPKKDEQPKKKAKPAKKEGADLEVQLLDGTDMKSFASAWVTACTAAEGKAITLLEALESQEKLIEMIGDAKCGMAEKRKALQSLGTDPRKDDVQTILDQAASYVIAYKKHVKVATNLINQHKKESQPKKKAKPAAQHFCLVWERLDNDPTTSKRLCIELPGRRRLKGPAKKSKFAALPPSRFQLWLCGSVDWADFWKQAASEDWGMWPVQDILFVIHLYMNHPVQSFDDVARSRAFGVTMHGDPFTTKFPFVVLKSDLMHYDRDGENISMDHIQASLVESLNLLADPNNGLGFTVHVVAGKGDWKFRKEWLKQSRFYGNACSGKDGLCQRCLASKTTWLDPLYERFNNTADLATARASAVGEIQLTKLAGWCSDMETADVLHCCWLGCGRDLNGSLCMLAARHLFPGATFDECLRALRKDMQLWCQDHGIRASTIDDLRISTHKFRSFPTFGN
ncbi:unnamed protein product [Symbiodinium sp. CCMP2456]|nr:unnamed protein product [Symbiodinium sp. CCMP2456]